MPGEIAYSLDNLIGFISTDSDPSIAFYGGGPLLRIDLMEEIMGRIDTRHFILQTNGLLLKRLKKGLIERFSTILVSIDGEEVTDFYRGQGL